MTKCKLCEQETEQRFNIKNKLTPICSNCERTIVLQSIADTYTNWPTNSNSTDDPTPHFRKEANGPVWVTYENGEEKTEPYKHQDGVYANLCAYPSYCRCSQ